MLADKYITEEVKKIDKDKTLRILWETVYNKRIKKNNNKKLAIISANATLYSECLKIFIKENKE